MLVPRQDSNLRHPLYERGGVTCGLSCGFAGRRSGRLLNRRASVLTVADPCIWHGSGTNLSRRQSATTAGAPTDQARVCLAVPPTTLATPPVPPTRASRDGRHMSTALELGQACSA